MRATLYTFRLSNPGHAARLMLERKGVDHRVVNLLPGSQAPVTRLLGFRGSTVPAIRFDRGRPVQGSRAIAQALDAMWPDPALFPGDRAARAAVLDAERWGEEVLQGYPRRILRWATVHRRAVRTWTARDAGLPLPALVGATSVGTARFYARRAGATDTSLRADRLALPVVLDRVDELLARGLLGGEDLNAADYQIGTTVRALLALADLADELAGRPAATHARRVLPDYPGPVALGLPAA